MEREIRQGHVRPANDNDGREDGSEREIRDPVDRVALTLARIIGRRMAREDFERLRAANDNRPGATRGVEDGVDGD